MECPELQHELFASIHCFIMGMCERHSVPPAAGKDLFHRLQGESFENPKEILSQVQVAATRIWTSTQKLQGAGRAREAQPALPLQERDPGGEDGEGRGGRARVPLCAVHDVLRCCRVNCAAFTAPPSSADTPFSQ